MASGKVRWGLLSTARINERLIASIRASERSDLLAVASRSAEKARRYAAEWDIQRAYGTYEDMLSDSEIDAVYVSLPNSLHARWSIASADAGKHVLCEKPLAVTAQEVERMADAGRRNGVLIQEATVTRFHAQTRKLLDLVSEGAIGDLRAMRGIFSFSLEREGDIRLDPALGGGSLWDLGSYTVCFMRTMMNANPVEVQGWQVTGPTGVDLTFVGQLRFPSGAIGQLFSSIQAVTRTEADLIGSRGIIHLDLPWITKIGVSANVTVERDSTAQQRGTFGDNPPEQKPETLAYENVNAYQDMLDSMVSSILDGTEPVITLEDSRDNAAAVEALYRSAREGRPVGL
jgi:predicted dehydrogenase